MKFTITFQFIKETKNAVRYEEVGDDGKPAFSPKIGAQYIQKSAMNGTIPKMVRATFESID